MGRIQSGCREVDEQVLVDGFERGSVVGISAEEEQMGTMLVMQTLASALITSENHRVMVITAQPQGVVAANIRDAIRRQVGDGLSRREMIEPIKQCLGRVSIARIFDLDGLWEVLGELGKDRSDDLEAEIASEQRPPMERCGEARQDASRKEQPPQEAAEPIQKTPAVMTEIPDSQAPGDDDLSDDMEVEEVDQSMPSPAIPAPEKRISKSPPSSPPLPPQPNPRVASETSNGPLPTIILIPQISNLLNSYFATHDKTSAHKTVEILGCHIHRLSRTLPSCPLILLLNGTTTTTTTPVTNSGPNPHDFSHGSTSSRDTLLSIFNTPPPAFGLGGYDGPMRRIRPSFGHTFAQLVDVHLLCTKVPKTVNDAEALYDAQGNRKHPSGPAHLAWVVEVLHDGVGAWKCSTEDPPPPRQFRHQRWGVVDLHRGRVMDAFGRRE
jgi:hypothetical protein